MNFIMGRSFLYYPGKRERGRKQEARAQNRDMWILDIIMEIMVET